MYIDIHTHHLQAQEGICVFNLEEAYDTWENYTHCSIGIHPWYISIASIEEQMAVLNRYASCNTVFAIGECGLDKRCGTPFTLQEIAFSRQVILANKINKPLIIHCVKAFNETLAILKKYRNTVPPIFHGFQKTKPLADLLIKNGCYLSFGASILQNRHLDSLSACPLNKLFLETDDSEIPIDALYKKAALHLKLPLAILKEQIQVNFNYIKNICKTSAGCPERKP